MAVLLWSAAIQIGLRLGSGGAPFDWWELAVIAVGAPFLAALISRFTHRILAQPLARLEAGIARIRKGELEHVQVSPTGDEIEFLGEGFNAMVDALSESRRTVAEQQEHLETRIRERTEALEEATGRALAASKAKSEFLANISHELRTPMNGVLGMLDIVLDADLAPAQREQVETAKNCAHTLLALLNDLLDLSKIEAGRMALESIPFSIQEVVKGCVLAVSPKAAEKGLEIRTTVEGDVPATLLGDPLRVRQILMNLVSNAVKFTEEGSVEVRVSRGKQTANQIVLQVAVADTGPGIPADKLTTIFDEFTQADGTVSRRFGGTGLGLAITRRLVELHEGSIRAESEMSKGSTFLVDLVLGYVAPPAAPEPADAPALLDEPKRETPLGEKILVVEDNAVNLKVVNAVLVKFGFQVTNAHNGVEAIAALEKQDFALILMDIQMPVMDGLATARRIRTEERWRVIPIVAMTAHAMRGDRERCLEAGMDDYLAKPVSPARLIEAVRANLRRAAEAGAGAPPMTATPPLAVAPMSVPAIDVPAAEPPVSATPNPPIDTERAAHLMDGDEQLRTGLTLLFLQLAPERLVRLHAATLRGDTLALRTQALKLQSAAERIAATAIAERAASIADIAATQPANYAAAELAFLEADIAALDDYMRPEREAFEEAASLVWR
ncbi:MAG: response regulator [Bryobacteraceae bacterium]